MTDKPTEKTKQQLIVEAAHPLVTWDGAVTNGFMRTCLELVGVPNRGTPYTTTQLVRLCQKNGLPWVQSTNEKPVIDR